jgi:hypothetical protein
MKLIVGALLLSFSTLAFSTLAFPNAVTEFKRHVTDWDYESTDQLGEKCRIELFGTTNGGLRIDLLATSELQFHLMPSTDYSSSQDLFVATTPANSDSGSAKTYLIVRQKRTLTIEREFTTRRGRVYLSGLTCSLQN